MVICPVFSKRAPSPATLLWFGLAVTTPFAQADCPTPPDWLDTAASQGFRWQGRCPAMRLDQAEGRLQLAPGGYVELTGVSAPATRLRCENDEQNAIVLRLKNAGQGATWQRRIAVAGKDCQWQGSALRCRAHTAWPVCVVESRQSGATVLSLNAAVQVKALPVQAPDETESAWLAQRQVAIDYCRERFPVGQPGELTIQLPAAGDAAALDVAWQGAAGQPAPGHLLQCLQTRLPQGPALPAGGRLLRLPWPLAKP